MLIIEHLLLEIFLIKGANNQHLTASAYVGLDLTKCNAFAQPGENVSNIT